MNKFVSIVSAVALAGATSIAGMAPVSAAGYSGRGSSHPNEDHHHHAQRDQMVLSFCQRHPRDRQCISYHRNRHNWSNRQYQDFYRSHRHDDGFGAAAAGIFGLAAGAIIGGALSQSNQSNWAAHVQACEAHYRSYDRRTDTYLGYDGIRHRCTY